MTLRMMYVPLPFDNFESGLHLHNLMAAIKVLRHETAAEPTDMVFCARMEFEFDTRHRHHGVVWLISAEVDNPPLAAIPEGRRLARCLRTRIGELRAVDETLIAASGCLLPPFTLNAWARICRKASDRRYYNLHTGERLVRNKGELIALMHSELSEAFEEERTGTMDSHLPHRPSAEVELADTIIRIFDYCGEYGYDLDSAVREKLEYNRTRADHTTEARKAKGGKKC